MPALKTISKLDCFCQDPATGSAHCTLGPYWASKLGKTELNAYQVSAFPVQANSAPQFCFHQQSSISMFFESRNQSLRYLFMSRAHQIAFW